MPEQQKTFQHLRTDELMPAEPVTTSHPQFSAPEHLQSVAVTLPERGLTQLYPVRGIPYINIPPHIYADEMRSAHPPSACEITRIQETVRSIYEGSRPATYDPAIEMYEKLMSVLSVGEGGYYRENVDEVKKSLDSYLNRREMRQNLAAESLSALIGRRELYLVVKDPRPKEQAEPRRDIFAGKLARIINVRLPSRMHLQPVLKGINNQEGLPPQGFRAISGVYAPAVR